MLYSPSHDPDVPTEFSDGELVQRVAVRDASALAVLYDRYRSFAFSIALRLLADHEEAEDVVQDAFLSVWRRAGSFDRERGNARSWIGAIVRYRAIDVARARRPRVDDDGEALAAVADPRSDVIDVVAATLDGQAVRDALTALPEDQRRAIALAYYSGLSRSEIARSIDVPLGTVHGRIRLGMLKMRRELEAAHLPQEDRPAAA